MNTQTVKVNDTRIRINLPKTIADELERRAASMYLSAEEYALCVLADCVRNDRMLVLQEH